MTVGKAGEHRVIALVRSRLPPAPAFVVHGIGDDAAVLEPPRNELEILTTDALVEGVHFDRRFVEPAAIGYRALAVSLSDLAAMGAAPRAALLSLALPADLAWADLEALVDGLVAGAVRYRVAIVGGNVTRSPGPLVVDVTLTGTAKRRKVLTRGGARAGDALFVTGTLGAAAAGLAWLQAHARGDAPVSVPEAHVPEALVREAPMSGAAVSEAPISEEPISEAIASGVERYVRPEPRLRFGVIAGRTRAVSACMDLSDGLADAVRQMADACGTGACIDEERLPIAEAATLMFAGQPEGPLGAALSGGEDYELLCAVPRRARRRFEAAAKLTRLGVSQVGELTPERVLSLRRRDGRLEPLPRGFEHFVTS